MITERMTARPRHAVVGLDVVALGAGAVVVVLVRAGQLGVERTHLRHSCLLTGDQLTADNATISRSDPSRKRKGGPLSKRRAAPQTGDANAFPPDPCLRQQGQAHQSADISNRNPAACLSGPSTEIGAPGETDPLPAVRIMVVLRPSHRPRIAGVFQKRKPGMPFYGTEPGEADFELVAA